MERLGFRQKSEEELRRQQEAVQLSRILQNEETEAQNPEEFAESLREFRKHVQHEEDDIELEHLREMADEQIAASVELLVQKGEYIAQGTYGVVFQVDLTQLLVVQQRLLEHEGVRVADAGNDAAAKILKIATPSNAEQEYARLKSAYDALHEGTNDDTFALQVPRPFGFLSHVKSTDLTKQMLASSKAKLMTPETGVIFMDRIQGKDLATKLYEFVLMKNGHGAQEIETMEFNDLMQLVGQILHFNAPGGKAWNSKDRIFEERKILQENGDKLAAYLTKFKDDPDFPVTEELLDVLEEGLKKLHAAGLSHNDLHERNLMLDENGDPYLVDFGRDDGDPSDDLMILRRYRSVVGPQKSHLDEIHSGDATATELLRKASDEKKEEIDALKKLLDLPEERAAATILAKIEGRRWSPVVMHAMSESLIEAADGDAAQALRDKLRAVMTKIISDPKLVTSLRLQLGSLFSVRPERKETPQGGASHVRRKPSSRRIS